MAPKALKRTGLIAGATAGAIGLGYATERALVARLRHRDDPDAGESLVPEFDEARTLDSHDGGTIYTIARGSGPVVVFCHGVTLSSRVWAKQFASFPAAGFRAVAFDSRGHGESVVGDSGHSLDNLADAIQGRAPQLLGRDDAVGQARVLEALYRSADEGRSVTTVPSGESGTPAST